VMGWISSYGPAFAGDGTALVDRIVQTVAEQGFRELASRKTLRRRCKDSYSRWQACRKAAYQRSTSTVRTTRTSTGGNSVTHR
jgi:hypothetical protein